MRYPHDSLAIYLNLCSNLHPKIETRFQNLTLNCRNSGFDYLQSITLRYELALLLTVAESHKPIEFSNGSKKKNFGSMKFV